MGTHMGTRRGPRKRLQGISIPMHLIEEAERLRELETEAYVLMGGDTKVSLSDVLSWALEDYLDAWKRRNGAPPAADAPKRARDEFVERLAKANLASLREQIEPKH